jgi:hypothetical protein
MTGIDRGAFLKLGLGLTAALAGCGSGDDASSPGGGRGGAGGSGGAGAGGGGGVTACTTDAALTQTSNNTHDHLPLTRPITAADLNMNRPTEYALPNESGHIHTLTFTAQDFAALQAGMTISKTSSVDQGHSHTYDIRCV